MKQERYKRMYNDLVVTILVFNQDNKKDRSPPDVNSTCAGALCSQRKRNVLVFPVNFNFPSYNNRAVFSGNTIIGTDCFLYRNQEKKCPADIKV